MTRRTHLFGAAATLRPLRPNHGKFTDAALADEKLSLDFFPNLEWILNGGSTLPEYRADFCNRYDDRARWRFATAAARRVRSPEWLAREI